MKWCLTLTKSMQYFQPFTFLAVFVLFWLTACENQVTKTSVSINSNSYYTVYQDSTDGIWRTRLNSHLNREYRGLSISFTVPDANSPYSIAFVCPSVSGNKPHETYLFYATPGELEVINFNCKRASQDIISRPIYGKIKGIKIAESDSPQGEQAYVSLGSDAAIKGWEAYAVIARSGTRDLVAYKGKQEAGQLLTPEVFYIQRNAARGITEESFRADVDFSGDDVAAYTARFDPNKLSTVNIAGIASEEIVESKLGFLSNKKSFLTLAESQQSNFSFFPVPLDIYTGSISGFTNINEFNPGEGHELRVIARDKDGFPIRKVQKFFTTSESLVHSVVLPKTLDITPIVSTGNIDELQQVILNWSAFRDPVAGKTQLYRWSLKGRAAEMDPDQPALTISDNVEWTIYVTPGWLQAAAKSTNNFSLILPADLKLNLTDNKGKEIYAWRQEWGFKSTTNVDWEFSAVVVNEKFNARDVVEYSLNRNFNILEEDDDGTYLPLEFVFGESSTHSTATSSN